jgi:MerR family transcriptional regulator, copper efflux regulator
MYIGRAAKATGASAKAIRLYESLGLIAPPERDGRYRVYGPQAVAAIRCIKQAQALGFSLKEIRALVGAGYALEASGFEAAVNRKLAQREALLAQTRADIAALRKLRTQVRSTAFCDAPSVQTTRQLSHLV